MSKGKFSFAHLASFILPGQRAESDDKDDKEKPEQEEEETAESGSESAGEGEGAESAAAPAATKPAAAAAATTDAVRQAALDERTRCATIFASPDAAGRVAMAASLAFETDLPAEQAIALLKTAPKQGASLATRMGTVPDPKLGSDGGNAGNQDEASNLAASILESGRKARGGK